MIDANVLVNLSIVVAFLSMAAALVFYFAYLKEKESRRIFENDVKFWHETSQKLVAQGQMLLSEIAELKANLAEARKNDLRDPVTGRFIKVEE